MRCCLKCDAAEAVPKWHGSVVNEVLSEGYRISRRRWRSDHPFPTRDDLAALELVYPKKERAI